MDFLEKFHMYSAEVEPLFYNLVTAPAKGRQNTHFSDLKMCNLNCVNVLTNKKM